MRNKHLQNPETSINQRRFHRRIGKLVPFLMCMFAFTAVKANPVDMQTAREIGAKFVNGSTAMRTTANDLRHVTTYRTDNNVAAFYVFNMANGFVIVAADDCSIPILAYSDEGPFNVDNIPVQMEGYLQVYRKEIQYGIERRLSGDETIAKQWNMLRRTGKPFGTRSTTAVEPLLSETWNQNCYYNALCPEDPDGPCGHVYAGCVATAMGQIMHYWKYPVVGSGSHTYYPDGYPEQTANFGATTYDWNNMPDNLTSSSSSTQINAVATLLWHCGIAVNMMYSPSGSGAYSDDVPYAMTEYFNYSDVLYGQYKEDNYTWLSMVKSNLDLGLPLYYSGSDVNGAGGHAFVCDGYDANDYLHFNWGWSGSGNNAYFAVDALNVGNYQFNNYNYAIFNLRPQTGNTYQITAEASPAEGGTVSGGGTYYEGRLCTLTAVSGYDYNFVNWTKDGNVVSTDPTFSFMVTEDATYVANFALFEGITIGSGTTTNEYLPSYSYYCYTLSEQIYTSEDLDMPGAITSLAFYNAGETKTRTYDIYMVNTEKTYFESSNDWITPTAEDLVFSGTVTMVSGMWTTFVFDHPFVYDGTNFALIVDDNTGSWTYSPHMACSVFGTESMQAMRIYSDGPDYDPFNPTQYQATGTYYEKNQIRITMESLTASTPMVNPEPIDLGYRPNGAWMPPYTFNLYNPGYYTTINSMSSTNPYFQLDTEGLSFPFNLGYHGNHDIKVNWGTGGGQINGLLNINYGDNESVQYNMIAHAYTPVRPDVWEKAQTVTSFPYMANLNSSTMSLYNNYRLPPIDIVDGADAVYKLVFTEDTYLSASVTNGEDGKVALYKEDFNGVGGPDLNNNYTAPEIPIEEWLYYDNGEYYNSWYTNGGNCIWGIRFSPDQLAAYANCNLTKISMFDSNSNYGLSPYTINIYVGGNTPDEGTLIHTQDFEPYVDNTFHEVFLTEAIDIDPSQNLWITLRAQANGGYPVACCRNVEDPNGRWYYSGSSWTEFTEYNDAAWMIRGFVTNTEGRTMAIEGGNRDNLTYDFEDSSMQGWTTFQGSNTTSPHSWITSAEHYHGLSGRGHNASQGFVLSESYITGDNYAVTPDNYLVSPLTSIGNGSVLNFWASDAHDSYGLEHFSVEISTTSNNNAAAFTPIFETTLLRGQGQRTGRAMRDVMSDGIWYEYNLDLSAYAGQQVYIAFHHFDCYDQWFLAIDDVTIDTGTPGGGGGGSITNITVTPGTYYLVASSTSNEWTVEINADEVPCPNPAYNPSPANYAEVNPERTIELSWQFGTRTTEYKLMFGTTESCEQTLVDWTRELRHYYTLPALLDDMTYYWKIVERNDGCSEGVSSPVWSFTTRLNPPQNLYAENNYICEGDIVYLYWSAPARALLYYNVYQDGELIGNTTETYFEVGGLTYNMDNGYQFHVTGVFDAGESDPSNYTYVYVSGLGYVNGFVYEQDGDTGIENATVTFTGYDEFGYYSSYSFTTDANGYYEGSLKAGSYSATASCAGYQDKYYGSVGIIFNTLTGGIDITMDELFNPVAEVLAEYYPDANDPSSPYVKVMWSNYLSGWHTYIESEFDNAYKSNVGNPSWGYEYPVEVISQYASCNLTKVAVFSDNIWGAVGGNFTCNIYLGGSAPEEGTLVSTITVDVPVNVGDWVEYNLVNPVHISGTEPLWVIWHANSTIGYDGGYPAGCASHSSSYGDWWNNGQEGWEHMGSCTWTMKNYFSNLSGRDVALTYSPSVISKGNGNQQNHTIANNSNHLEAHEIAINPNPERIPFEVEENDRSLQYYRVYRTNAYNNGPYTSENTEVLSDQLYDTLYIDASWIDAAPGVYKWGIGSVYSGNRSNEIEGPISWAKMNTPSRDVTFSASVVPNANTNVGRARDGWLAYDDGTYATSIGNATAYDWMWGVMYPASMLGSNNTLSKVAIYNTSYNVENITIDIYQGGASEPGTLIASQTVTPTEGLQEVTLTSPVAIDPSQNLWITLSEYGTYVMSSCNSTEPNNQWVESDGWYILGDLASSLAGYGWMIRAYVEYIDNLQEPRESEIAWSNFLDKDMYLNNGAVNVTVSLNSGDSPAGTTVSFINLNSAEQLLYPIADITLDNTGYYAWDNFRKGEYEVTVAKDGYVTYIGYESIWDATALSYMLEEIMQSPTNLYVSSTGWAKWNGMGNDLNQIITSGETSFTEGFEGSLNGWNVLTVNAAGGHWLHSNNNPSGYDYASHAHGGSGFAMCYSFIDYDGAYDTDSYLYTPQKYDIVNGSTLTFFADNANDSYPESFSVCVATADNPTASDFVTVWSGSAKDKGGAKANVRHDGNRYDNWRSHSVDLSAYAGQSVWIAFHDVNYDMYEVWIDDVELTTSRNSDRHYEYNQVVLSSTQGGILYTENTINKYCQLPVENLVEGNTYHCKVASIYSSGMTEWVETDWVYQACDNYEGASNLNAETTEGGNLINWTYPENERDGNRDMLLSISDDFNDGIINTELWTYTGSSVYEEEGLLKLEQNITDDNVVLESQPLSVPANNIIVLDRSFFLHEVLYNSYWGTHYYYGRVTLKLVGSEENYIGIVYYDDDYENRHGTYLYTQINGETNETRICDAFFDTWLTEYIVVNIEDNTVSYYLNNDFVAMVDIPAVQATYYTVEFRPYGWWTGHYHYMDYVNINSGNMVNSVLGAMVYRDNELVGFTSDSSFLDQGETSSHEYSIRVVYGGTAICPEENNYFSMSCPQSTMNDDEFHWDVNINEYPFNMTVTGIIQIDGVEQTNPNLEIGAFCNGECRGVQRLTYYPQINRYLVFLMVYGENGDEIDFMLYDHGTGTETSGCTSHITFAANSAVGTTFNPHIFNFANGHISQFLEGWNWWSTYIEMDGIDGLSMLENGLGTNGIIIKSQSDGYTEYYDDYGIWYGSLNSINNESSYLVKTTMPCQVSMNGAIAVPSNHPITVDANGWTWIGYPVAYNMDINAAMGGLASVESDMLKSQSGYAEFYDGYGWFGSLETLSPGMGYMYKSNNASPTTFTYPNNGKAEMSDNLTIENNYWESNPSAYPYNMTVTAVVELDGEELRSDRYELAAFANGESRGSVRLMYVEPIDRYVAFLTIAGEEATELSLSLYDMETGMEYFPAEENIVFEADATLGRLAEPFVVSFRGTTGVDELANSLRVYPNPVKAGERFSIGMNAESKAPVRVEIVNALGAVVSVETSTQAPASIVAPATAGIYTLRVTVDGKGTIIRKLVVK